MNAIIVAIVSAVVSTLLTNVLSVALNRKYTMQNTDLDVLRKTCKCYKNLYLKIVKDQKENRISDNFARTNLAKIIKDLEKDDTIFLLMTDLLYNQILDYDNSPTDLKLQKIQSQIEQDFDEIKFKLGYPNNNFGWKIFCKAAGFYFLTILLWLFLIMLCLFHSYSDIRIVYFLGTACYLMTLICTFLYFPLSRKPIYFSRLLSELKQIIIKPKSKE